MALSLVQQLELEEGVDYIDNNFLGVSFTRDRSCMVDFLQGKIFDNYLGYIDDGEGEKVAKEFRDYFENLTEIPKEFEFLT